MTALVVALAGTDHHPFERMVQWMDTAAKRRSDVRFVVQHGASTPPSVAVGHAFLAHDELVGLLQEASVVVCHGGPGTIMDAREAGHVPLCLPRDPRLGEHVDGHQQRFATTAERAGVVRVVSTVETFELEIEHALSAPSARSVQQSSSARDAARAAVAAELNSLMLPRPRRMGMLRASR